MIIGITGSISTGKSAVSSYLQDIGYTVIDSDKIVHNLLTKKEVIDKIAVAFGSGLVKDRILNKKKLGEIIYNNEEKRLTLNSIIHPLVIRVIQEETNNYKNNEQRLIFVDIPLLYETELENLVDKIIVVYVPYDVQLKRLMLRDNIDMEYARQKIKASMDIEIKKEKADYVIDNSLILANTYKQIDEVLRRIKNEI